MKKILLFAIALISSALVFTACDDDRDSNPTLHEPTEFVLNTPAYAETLLDLESSETMTLTFSQPNYGYTAAVTYQVQVSLDGDFSLDADDIDEDSSAQPTCATVNESYTSCIANVSCSLLARAIMEVAQWEDEESVPSELEVYVRMIATVDKYVTPSNDVTIRVIPMYVALDAAAPEIWFLVGGCIADGTWGEVVGVSAIPMQTIAGETYDKDGKGNIQYIGYFLAGGDYGFKLRGSLTDSWAEQVGSDGAGGSLHNDGLSGNFTVDADGYYILILNTSTYTLTINPYTEEVDVYSQMLIAGSFNAADDGTWLTDKEMTAACTNVDVVNHDWVYTLEVSDYDEVKFLADTSWSKNWGASDFPMGIGVNNGTNIPVPAGKWTICFNDITGFYYFTEAE